MSQRDSGYERKERDLYETPEWVTLALFPHLPNGINDVWEPAAATGKMVRVLKTKFRTVIASDIIVGHDFLTRQSWPCDAIITNPPYELAEKFIDHAMSLTNLVAMLLRTDFDHATTRQRLFSKCNYFWKKVVLTKRIRWIEGSNGSPSFNHAWFIWNKQKILSAPPILAYGPEDVAKLALV